ncbi:ankyrin, partial [Neoconidiobolus thromboides FSU 785]
VDNIKVLIELGADPTKLDNDGRTPLAIAASLGHAASCQLFTSLEKYPINQPDLQGNTPLSLAVIGNHLDAVVQLLLDAKVNVNKADLYGWTPLMLASHLGYLDLIEPL